MATRQKTSRRKSSTNNKRTTGRKGTARTKSAPARRTRTAAPGDDAGPVGRILTEALQDLVVDDGFAARLEAQIEERIQEEVDRRGRVLVVRNEGTGETVRMEHTHQDFPVLLRLAERRENILLVGPSGSFKTTSAWQLAKALGLPFASISLGPTITETRIFGYLNADGDYVGTPFRRIYEEGGVFLFDEFDNANPLVLNAVNNALDNRFASFPDHLVERHPDAVFVCTANTWGRGGDRLYVGRSPLDASTLDRFVAVPWDYDEGLERELAGNDAWTDHVQAVRRAVAAKGVAHIVSPRASIKGARLLEAGFPRRTVEEMLLWKGLEDHVVESVLEAVRSGDLPEATSGPRASTDGGTDAAAPHNGDSAGLLGRVERTLRARGR